MINKKEIEQLAALSRIELSEAEKEALAADMESILGYVSELSDVAAHDDEPEVGAVHTVLREDLHPHESGRYTDELLALVPSRKGNYVKVKKIL